VASFSKVKTPRLHGLKHFHHTHFVVYCDEPSYMIASLMLSHTIVGRVAAPWESRSCRR